MEYCNCGVSVRCCDSLNWRVGFIIWKNHGKPDPNEWNFSSKPEMFSQIYFSHAFIINDFISITASQYFAVADNIGVIADAQRFPDIMIGNEHADVAFLEKPDDLLDIQHGNRVHTCKWFIQEDKARQRCQCPGNFNTAPLAAG